ncbi:hypothetical protein [Enterovibrio sp. 27052020O]|uniref:hypothetical protein n=1 Tax=Enterovibrio sp. 27052020O TaxID=3241166 RepID=UPI00388FECEF
MSEDKDIASALSHSPMKSKRFSDIPKDVVSRYQFLLYPKENQLIETIRASVSPSASRSEAVRAAVKAFNRLPKEEQQALIKQEMKQE